MFDQYAVGVGGPANNFKPAVTSDPGELLGTERQKAPRGGGASPYTVPSGMVVGKPTGSEGAPPTLAAGGKDGFVFMMQTNAWGSWVYEIESTTAGSALCRDNGQVWEGWAAGGERLPV
jgi:hypothetical protein